MAAFSLTAVKLISGDITAVTLKENASAGSPITRDGWIVDPSNSTRLEPAGLVILGGSTGEKAAVALPGSVVSFTNSVTQARIVLAATSGQLQYDTDQTSTQYAIIIGITKTTGQIQLIFNDTGITKS